MSPDDIALRLLNPTVILTMILAGVAYGAWLWTLNIRCLGHLISVGIFPGAIFLVVVWSIRAFQGVPSLTYAALLVDWMLFSTAGVVAVLATRRWFHGRVTRR